MDEEEPTRIEEEGTNVSLFDYSIENHMKALNSITDLCGDASADFDENQINRLSSSITFLREWRHFNYMPRTIKFFDEMKAIPETNEIILPQYSSASVQKGISDESSYSVSSKDFVMYVGGSVWALDWCPRVHEYPDGRAKCEFLAVSAHPPESYTHKIGARLTGRGIIQIWCILNVVCEKDTISIPEQNQKYKSGKPRGRPRKASPHESLETTKAKRPRGRPRKHPIATAETRKSKGRPRKQTIDDFFPGKVEVDGQFIEALSGQCPEESVVPLATKAPFQTSQGISETKNVVNSDDSTEVVSSGTSITKLTVQRMKSKVGFANQGCSLVPSDVRTARSPQKGEEELMVVGNVQDKISLDVSKNVALPRVVLCLAHNGKVAWDMKWRPSGVDNSQCKQIMGYLAVLLGNGSLEVWEVPMPQVLITIFSKSSKPKTDPRFVKLAPIFRCSELRSGHTQSIPLTVEWSSLENPNFLLAGCHDGSVAMWKFCATKSTEDTRPLLYFSADTAPIRSVAWAPVESDQESANLIATAGHGGVKFWDIRDPFRPLWDLHIVPRFIYSLNWLPDPRCVLLSYDDGTLRMVSLMKTAYDVAATGKPFPGTKQQGLGVYNCSSFPIWNAQVSPLTGIAAYCSADGSVLHFHLTTKAVEKDSRYRTPHFRCGFLTVKDSTFTVHTPRPNDPITLKRVVKESGETQRCLRSLLSESNNKSLSIMSDHQPLALQYCGDQSSDSRSEETSTFSHANLEGITKEIECENRGNSFPPRMVGMQRLRWNMNKGSERWLCYGGAAGIVRCQEIALPVTKSTQ